MLTLAGSVSNPVTLWPASANRKASGKPTYPQPMMPTLSCAPLKNSGFRSTGIIYAHAPSGELLQAGTTRLIQNKKITCEAPKRLADSLRYAKISIESASLTYMTIVVLIIGFCAGSLVGLLGICGGVVLVPAMVHLLHMDQHAAQGTSLFVLLPPIGLGALLEYRKKGNVDFYAGGFCALGMLVGGYFGGLIAVPMSSHRLTQFFGGFLMLAALLLLAKTKRKAEPVPSGTAIKGSA